MGVYSIPLDIVVQMKVLRVRYTGGWTGSLRSKYGGTLDDKHSTMLGQVGLRMALVWVNQMMCLALPLF